MLLSALATTTWAQKGLHIAEAFERLGHEKGCKMVEMHDTHLRGYELKTYQSLTYRTQGSEVARLLEQDRRQARKIREVVSDGQVQSGYYMMPPLAEGTNRYVLYTRKADGSGAVIYIEGALSPDDILKMCYKKK